MSYDLHLFVPKPGQDPLETARTEAEADEIQMSAESMRANGRVVERVAGLGLGFEIHESPAGLELSWEDAERAFQVFLGESTGAVNLPYWDSNRAPDVIERLSAVLRIACEERDFAAYDPQTDALVRLDGGKLVDEGVFARGASVVRDATGRRPWWRFW